MLVTARKTRLFIEGEDLISFITSHVKTLPEKSVLVVTSKIVALAEKRTVIFDGNKNTKAAIIKKESQYALETPLTWLTVKDGQLMAAAGVDESNANGKLILLPKDSFRSARALHTKLKKYYGVKQFGILITDSRCLPLRAGTIGMALGFHGFSGVRDYRGTPDLFGRIMRISRTNNADSLATAAVLCMGEGTEQQPIAVICDAPVVFTDNPQEKSIGISMNDDMYAPLLAIFQRKKRKKQAR